MSKMQPCGPQQCGHTECQITISNSSDHGLKLWTILVPTGVCLVLLILVPSPHLCMSTVNPGPYFSTCVHVYLSVQEIAS